MKKIYPVLTLMTVLTVLPAIGAANNRAEFFKSFANCKPASYTANFDDGSQIQRSVIGAGSVKGIYACQYKEVYSNGKTDRKSTRLNSSHSDRSRMPSSA